MEHGDKAVQALEEELQYYRGLIEEERVRLNELQQQRGIPSSDSDWARRAAERRFLTEENAALRQHITKLKRAEQKLAHDPQVLDARNKVAAVRKEVNELAKEVETLEVVRQQWKKNMNEVRARERSVTAIRGKQFEEQQELRVKLRELTEELRRLEKGDIQLHERFALLQKQVATKVQEKDVVSLREKIEQQDNKISMLRGRREELRARRADLLDDDRRLAFREGRARAKMEKDIRELKALVLQRDEELGQLYRNVGRMRGGQL
ncbi:hypothetical protein DQ04_00621050 [Trypanosoma grayi]|uniref:hypothetical protein n=1 Tax=Trypanosoma grayi TaxID=71804 RepID=UPI0004F45AD1|nr:hypothetical protein DQ04_00621050 [Trypanosoma grayi]KEG14096.1 hypothetical protein DQ04_00621050 [Trypanosoma grayi]